MKFSKEKNSPTRIVLGLAAILVGSWLTSIGYREFPAIRRYFRISRM